MSNKDRKDVTVIVEGVEAKAHAGRLAAKGAIRKGQRKGRRKYDYESIKGNEFSSNGTFVQKERVIDRENNLYKELVINVDTGEILHSSEHPLSEHKDHGSAKVK